MDKDKLVELHRYDARAQSQLSASGHVSTVEFGSSTMPLNILLIYIFSYCEVVPCLSWASCICS